MIIKGNSCKILKSIFEIVQEFLEEAVFSFSDKGIYLVDTDKSNVMVISIAVKKECFTEYEIGEGLKIIVPLKKVFEIFKKTRDEERFTLKSDGNRLTIILEGNIIKECKIMLISPEYKQIDEPGYNFSIALSLPLESFEEIVDNARIMGEELNFNVAGEDISFRVTSGAEEGKFSISEALKGSISLKNPENKTLESKYDLNFLERITRVIKSIGIEKCDIFFDENLPLRIKLSNEIMTISFYLGPRI